MKIKVIGKLNRNNYRHGNEIFDIDGICVCLTCAMGAGGGHIPLILVEYEREKHGRQENAEPTEE